MNGYTRLLVVVNILHFIYESKKIPNQKIDKIYKLHIITVEDDSNHGQPLIEEKETDEMTPPRPRAISLEPAPTQTPNPRQPSE